MAVLEVSVAEVQAVYVAACISFIAGISLVVAVFLTAVALILVVLV